MRKNSFYLYLKYYKKCINNFRKRLQYLFGRMNDILSDYESEEIEDFSTLLEKKLNLNFDLPINIPFLDRLEIAVNRKLTSVFRRELSKIEKDLLNLFKNNLDKLSLFNENPNDFETIKFKSSVDFNLSGIGVVMMDSEDSDLINVKLFKGNKLIEDKIYFTEYDEEKKIKIGIFKSYPLEVERDTEYSIVLNGIQDLLCVNILEKYNENSKIQISSSNSKTNLACLIV